MRCDVEYARELAAALRQTFPNALDNRVTEAVRTVGERMADDARKFCPVRTGFLRSTIALDQPTGAKWVFYLLARAPYAIYVEYGTRRMHPRLFMTRAVELHKDEMTQEVKNAVFNAAVDSLG
jgi:HK97 gp10 family phage protein